MCAVAESFGLAHEEKAREIQNWQEFFDWRYEVMEEGYAYPGRRAGEQIEGFVIEDSGGYMTKLKLPYYNFWKRMRTVAREVAKKGSVSNTAALATAEANEFYGWLRGKYDSGELKGMPKDICSLRRMFLDGSMQGPGSGKDAENDSGEGKENVCAQDKEQERNYRGGQAWN